MSQDEERQYLSNVTEIKMIARSISVQLSVHMAMNAVMLFMIMMTIWETR